MPGRHRLASRLAWPLCALAIAGGIGVVVLDILDRATIHSLPDAEPTGIVLPVSFSLLGAIIVSRQPGNRIGWIYLLIGVLMPLQPLGDLYYERSLLSHGLQGGRWGAWLGNWAVPLVFPAGLALFAFLLFPSGSLPSPRWRWVAWLAIGMTVLGIVTILVDPSPISVESDLPEVANPTGVAALGSSFDVVGAVWWFLGLALIATTIGSLVLRGRRAAPHERQQVKLLAYAGALTIGFLIVVTIVGSSIGSWFDVGVVLGFGVAVPVACGVSILKHGLYGIDRLISRTLSYTLLTAILVGVFAGIVVTMTDVLPFSSPVAVAASTLAAAALFNPLRRRTQRLIDRRFNRARYDAEASLAAFAGRLRDAVDLDTIGDELVAAVDQAVAPTHISLWMTPSAPGPG